MKGFGGSLHAHQDHGELAGGRDTCLLAGAAAHEPGTLVLQFFKPDCCIWGMT
jgi:hypothetical protein